MAFENTLQAIAGYNTALKGGQLVDEGHLTFVLQTLFVDIQNAISTGSSGDFLPLTGGALDGLVEYNADLSGSYTDRSLIDRSYFEDTLEGALENYLSLEDGGTINSAVTITEQLRLEGSINMEDTSISGVSNISSFDALTELSIADGIWFNGSARPLDYAGDYSTNYTNRSLVDKEYVDLAIQAAIDALP